MKGYAKLANLMGNDHTDGHFLIFQKFEQLSAQNLLYLQAEIVDLQESLADCIKEDTEHPDRQAFATDWWKLSSSKATEQWDTWRQLRSKLKEYCKLLSAQIHHKLIVKDEAIAQHRMISSISKPHKSDLKFLQQWLERPGMGDCEFTGADRDIYESHHASGLGSLALKSGDIDPLTKSLLYMLPRLYHYIVVTPLYNVFGRWVKKPDVSSVCSPTVPSNNSSISQDEDDSPAPEDDRIPNSALSSSSTAVGAATTDYIPSISSEPLSFDTEGNIFLYRDSYFHYTANILGTLISSLIPIAAIVVLYFVSNMVKRLAIVCTFTAIFSIALSLVTMAKRVEIFAATAAFASVQVVFIGSVNSF
ncbi:hypothetical protein B7494_g2578 [Chlorociboria aeruginascens]|nr:hypothetical protein B7494_g2578 [Chlorociboria aeruginascens]